MKKKKIILVSALCALMSFSFVGCSDDDEPIVPNVPNVSVSGINFQDMNPESAKISGTLTWSAPASVEGITKYVIYGSSNGTSKDVKVGEVSVGTNSYEIKDLPNLGYLLIVAANNGGEAQVSASFVVNDFVDDGSFMTLYFLSEGSKFEGHPGMLSRFDIEKGEMIKEGDNFDYFEIQNGRKLGMTAQDMIVYGDKMYISMTGESTIEVTDLQAKSIKQIKTDGEPRYMVSNGGKVYVTYYNGYVARLDTASLEVEAKVQVGRSPEKLTISNNKLFVANSGGADFSTIGPDNTVSVVDLATFKEEKKIEVVLNPVNIEADEQGYVYVVSMGDYKDIPNTFQRINAESGEVTVVKDCPNVTEMTYLDGKLYMWYAQWDENGLTPTYLTYDTKTQKVGENFISVGTKIASPYKISNAGGKIYVSNSVYKQTGEFYGFDTDGKMFEKFEAWYNPSKVVLVQKNPF